MRFISRSLNVLCSTALVFSLSAVAFGDTIRLKDGSIIKGHIVSFGKGEFVVEMGDGSKRRQMTFAANEVESIRFDSPTDVPAITKSTNRTASYSQPEPNVIEPKPGPKPQPKPVVKTPAKTYPQAPPAKTYPPSTQAPAKTTSASPVRTGGSMKPVEVNIKVFADNTSNGWTNSGWVVKKGQRVHIMGDGSVSLGKGRTSPPAGLSTVEDNSKLMKSVPTGALIAVIGDDNNEFIYVGAEREFTASRDGALFLGVNEGDLNDNSGTYDVKIEILPE